MKKVLFIVVGLILTIHFVSKNALKQEIENNTNNNFRSDVIKKNTLKQKNKTNTGNFRRNIVKKAEQYLGSPYKYAGTSPKGFDCSGFVYFIFKSFDINVPRSSKAYSDLDKAKLDKAQIGDVIVFTGYKDTRRLPGHVGIISKINNDTLYFIHSSTNKGVIETELNSTYYTKRFLFVVNVLEK